MWEIKPYYSNSGLEDEQRESKLRDWRWKKKQHSQPAAHLSCHSMSCGFSKRIQSRSALSRRPKVLVCCPELLCLLNSSHFKMRTCCVCHKAQINFCCCPFHKYVLYAVGWNVHLNLLYMLQYTRQHRLIYKGLHIVQSSATYEMFNMWTSCFESTLNDIALGSINHIYFPSAILSCRFLMWVSFPWASLHDRPGCVGRRAILCGPLLPSPSTCVTFKGKKKEQILQSYNPDEDN